MRNRLGIMGVLGRLRIQRWNAEQGNLVCPFVRNRVAPASCGTKGRAVRYSTPLHAELTHMNRRTFLATASVAAVASRLPAAEPAKITVGANDWPWWRGPTRDGVAAPG